MDANGLLLRARMVRAKRRLTHHAASRLREAMLSILTCSRILIVSMLSLHGLTGCKVLKHRPFSPAAKQYPKWPLWAAWKPRLARGDKQVNHVTKIKVTSALVQVEQRKERSQSGPSSGRASLPRKPDAARRIHLRADPTPTSLTRPHSSQKSTTNTKHLRPDAELQDFHRIGTEVNCITAVSIGHDEHKTEQKENKAERKDDDVEAYRAGQRNLASQHDPWVGCKASKNYAKTAMLMFLAMLIVWV